MADASSSSHAGGVTAVCFTGSRLGMAEEQWLPFRRLLALLFSRGARTLEHGCCLGADRQAAALAAEMLMLVVARPGRLTHWVCPEAAALSGVVEPARSNRERNLDLARRAAAPGGVLLACPSGPERAGDQLRSGTWQTVRMAARLRAPAAVVLPSGEVAYSPPWLAAFSPG